MGSPHPAEPARGLTVRQLQEGLEDIERRRDWPSQAREAAAGEARYWASRPRRLSPADEEAEMEARWRASRRSAPRKARARSR